MPDPGFSQREDVIPALEETLVFEGDRHVAKYYKTLCHNRGLKWYCGIAQRASRGLVSSGATREVFLEEVTLELESCS